MQQMMEVWTFCFWCWNSKALKVKKKKGKKKGTEEILCHIQKQDRSSPPIKQDSLVGTKKKKKVIKAQLMVNVWKVEDEVFRLWHIHA